VILVPFAYMYIVVVVYIAIRLSDFSARSVLVVPQRPESVKAAMSRRMI
jgi:hypothetical protein